MSNVESNALVAFLLVIGVQCAVADCNYTKALDMSFQFYEAQQSGALPTWNRNRWRGNAHLNDGLAISGGIGVDLAGGHYDAGDTLKLQLPYGVTWSTIAWAGITFEQAYRAAGQWDILKANLKWATDFILKSHLQASDTPIQNTYVAQVGDVDQDHSVWDRPESALPSQRRLVSTITCTSRGSDIVAEAAAALMATAAVFSLPGGPPADAAYAVTLTQHARQLYAFAKACPGVWHPTSGSSAYPSSSHTHHLAWAAAWMCHADSLYCPEAAGTLWQAANNDKGYSYNTDWDNVLPQASTLLLQIGAGTVAQRSQYQQQLQYLLGRWMDTSRACSQGHGDYTVCYTPKGLAYLAPWGSLRETANTNLVALVWATTLPSAAQRRTIRCFAWGQMELILGKWGRSFVVGFGTNPPVAVHHRGASCPTNLSTPCGQSFYSAPGPNPNVLYGALVGGPGRDDAFLDERSNYQQDEPALDYNAGYTGALAGLLDLGSRLPAGGTWSQYCAGTADEGNTTAPPSTLPLRPPSPPLSKPPPQAPPPLPMVHTSPPPLATSLSPPVPPPPTSSPLPPTPTPPPPPPPPLPQNQPHPPPAPALMAAPPVPPPLVPASPPPPSPQSSSACPASAWYCQTCMQLVAQAGPVQGACLSCASGAAQPYACHQCITASGDGQVQQQCLGCVGSAKAEVAWACPQLCGALAATVGDAIACTSCIINAPASSTWGCGNCLQSGMAAPAGSPQLEQCLGCVGSGNDPSGCAWCAALPTAERRSTCFSCLAEPGTSAWACVHP